MRGGEHLYIIQSAVTGAFKVGRSSNVEARLKQLQTGSPYDLRIICTLENQGYKEKRIHRRLKGYESQTHHGSEWFIEPGLASLGDDIYGLLNPCAIDLWWETERGAIHSPGPPKGWGVDFDH